MSQIEVRTQTELNAALKRAKATDWIVCVGDGYFDLYDSAQVRASGSAQVTAYDSAQVTAYGSAQVTAYDSAQVRAYDSAQVRASGSAQVTAYDSAQVRASGSAQVRAYGSAQVTAYDSAQVRAYGSAQVRAYGSAQVTAYDSAQVRAYGSAQVRASKYVAVTTHSSRWGTPKITGGVLIEIPTLTTVAEWLDHHGVAVKRGIAVLFKAVDEDYSTDHARRAKIAYTPGSKPAASDWLPTPECGNGIHVSPRPVMALRYHSTATRYVACPVKVADLVVIGLGEDGIPDKGKVPAIARPVYEVDIDGQRLEAAA